MNAIPNTIFEFETLGTYDEQYHTRIISCYNKGMDFLQPFFGVKFCTNVKNRNKNNIISHIPHI